MDQAYNDCRVVQPLVTYSSIFSYRYYWKYSFYKIVFQQIKKDQLCLEASSAHFEIIFQTEAFSYDMPTIFLMSDTCSHCRNPKNRAYKHKTISKSSHFCCITWPQKCFVFIVTTSVCVIQYRECFSRHCVCNFQFSIWFA